MEKGACDEAGFLQVGLDVGDQRGSQGFWASEREALTGDQRCRGSVSEESFRGRDLLQS